MKSELAGYRGGCRALQAEGKPELHGKALSKNQKPNQNQKSQSS